MNNNVVSTGGGAEEDGNKDKSLETVSKSPFFPRSTTTTTSVTWSSSSSSVSNHQLALLPPPTTNSIMEPRSITAVSTMTTTSAPSFTSPFLRPSSSSSLLSGPTPNKLFGSSLLSSSNIPVPIPSLSSTMSSSASPGKVLLLTPVTSSSSSGPPKLHDVLGDLQLTRVRVETDQKNYEEVCRENRALDEKLKEALIRRSRTQNGIKAAEEKFAVKAADFAQIKARLFIGKGDVDKLREEVDEAWKRNIEVRDKTLSASSRYLNDCVDFALTYNGTEIGAQRRKEAMLDEWEDAKEEKHRLECELQDFLSKKEEVDQAESEIKSLEEERWSKEDGERVRENEANAMLNEAQKTMQELTAKKVEMEKNFAKEYQGLEAQLHATNNAIAHYERQVADTQRAISLQTAASAVTVTATSAAVVNAAPKAFGPRVPQGTNYYQHPQHYPMTVVGTKSTVVTTTMSKGRITPPPRPPAPIIAAQIGMRHQQPNALVAGRVSTNNNWPPPPPNVNFPVFRPVLPFGNTAASAINNNRGNANSTKSSNSEEQIVAPKRVFHFKKKP